MTATDMERIINQRYGDMYRQAMAVLKHPYDAEDAVQTACLKAWEHYHELLDESRCRSWLNTLVYHECVTILRHRRRDGAVVPLEEADMRSGYGLSPDAVIGYWQILDDIASMPHICQQAFILRYDVGYSVQTIADLLCISRCTVSSRLHRARTMLIRRLAMVDARLINMVS